MHLTPEMLRHAYGMLRETMPFRRWNLPSAEDMHFAVLKTPLLFGDFSVNKDGDFRIRLSRAMHNRFTGLLATMAHEMCHLRIDSSPYRVARTAGGMRIGVPDCVTVGTRDRKHAGEFRRLARLVCQHHPEFDPTTF